VKPLKIVSGRLIKTLSWRLSFERIVRPLKIVSFRLLLQETIFKGLTMQSEVSKSRGPPKIVTDRLVTVTDCGSGRGL